MPAVVLDADLFIYLGRSSYRKERRSSIGRTYSGVELQTKRSGTVVESEVTLKPTCVRAVALSPK